ncbi:MAG: DUF6055 domain-containing protein [Myxococcota bacterium]
MLDCGTVWMRDDFDLRPPEVAPLPPDAHKGERDAWGTYPYELASENFVVKWGTSGSVGEDDVEALLASFETAWAEEIEAWGMPQPRGTESSLFNVYVGDTGDGTPSSYGAGGYYDRDDDGYPFVVIARDSLRDAAYAQSTAAHEFFHALQDETESYGYTGDAAWFWEASACWAEGEVFPENDSYAQFLFGYALLPHYALDFFDYPDTGELQEYHQYGAFIFPRFVSEVAADRAAVVEAWTAPVSGDPIEGLAAGLDVPMADAFAEFAARNATWDYADGEAYADHVSTWSDWLDVDVVVGSVRGGEGTDGLVEAPEDTLPERYGYNVVRIRDAERVRVTFEGDAEGSRGGEAAWRATVVTVDGEAFTRTPLDGELEAGSDGDAWLVVAAVPDEARAEETFAWRYAVEPVEVEPAEDTGDPAEPLDVEEGGGGCGCGASSWGRVSRPPLAWLALAGLALTRARGRRPARS